MIAPGLARAVGAVVALKTHLSTNASNKLPGLPALDGPCVVIGLGIEEDEVLWGLRDARIGGQVLGECLADALVDHYFVALRPRGRGRRATSIGTFPTRNGITRASRTGQEKYPGPFCFEIDIET